jgi:hypothetical protein
MLPCRELPDYAAASFRYTDARLDTPSVPLKTGTATSGARLTPLENSKRTLNNPMNSTPTSSSPSDSLSAKASHAGQQIKEAARDAAGQVKETASQTASKLKESAAEIAAQRRSQAADQVGRVGQSLHNTAQSMEEEDPNIAHYAHRIADRLDHVAEYVRNRDLAALKDDASDMARRHPVAFFGGLFVAGLVVGNLVKAGATSSQDHAHAAAGEPEGTPQTSAAEQSAAAGSGYAATSSAGI